MLSAEDADLSHAPLDDLSQAVMPRHVAIIMDGNGRWAMTRSLPRTEGHRQGVAAVHRAVRAALDFGIEYLTIYSFSSENWSRPATEVEYLLALLRRFIHRDVADLHAQGVKIKVIGERKSLEPDLRRLIEHSEDLTRENTNMTLVVAFNYGSRCELTRTVKAIAEKVRRGDLDPDAICADTIKHHLDTDGIPDPDLIVRTSGEQRLSNFLLWQSAYSEFVFIDEHWPDFDRSTFEKVIRQYLRRDRRFGGVNAAGTPQT